MVAAVHRGRTVRSVAREFSVSHRTVQNWLARAGDQRLGQVDWSDRRRGPHCPANRIAAAVEEEILRIRENLRLKSDLGEFGAAAIRRELLKQGNGEVPSIR